MTYNNPQHNTTKYSCTPFPILKEGDTSSGIVTYLDLVDLGSITGFGVNLKEIGGTQRWDNTTINSWQTLFEAINEHLTIFNARLEELEQSANPDAVIITSKSNNQLEANVDNVSWSSSSAKIIVNPSIGKTTTYSLSSSATSYGSFRLTASASSIQEGSNITITAQWTGKTTTYDAIITAAKSGMTAATKQVQLSKDAICPTSVTLDNGKTITLNANGTGSVTYAPTVGSYTVKTQGNETQGSCSFTVTAKINTENYYLYIGLNKPTSSTNPDNDLSSNNTPLYEGYRAAGWINLGSTISQYNASNPAYNGGNQTIILDADFDDVTCYIAVPSGMKTYDGLGNPISWILEESNITIKSHSYDIYRNTVEGEMTNLIY